MEPMGQPKAEKDFFLYIEILLKWRRFIVFFVAVVVFIFGVVSFFLPKYYEAKATVLPITRASSPVTGLLGGLAGFVGVTAGSSSDAGQIMVVLKSRSFSEAVVKKYNLAPALLQKTNVDTSSFSDTQWAALGGKLKGMIKLEDDISSGAIVVKIESQDPQFSFDLAKKCIDTLKEYLSERSFTTAKRNRIYIEGQLMKNKKEWLQSGKELSEFYKGGKVSSVESVVDVPVNTVDVLGNSHEQSYKSPTFEKELEQLESIKQQIEYQLGTLVKTVPQQVYLNYLAMRQQGIGETYGILASQYELARIEEARDEPTFEVIDPPIFSSAYSRPNKMRIFLVSLVFAVFSSMFIVFCAEFLKEARKRMRI